MEQVSTVEVCWNNNDSYFIWIKLCAKVWTNSFQEVLGAVLVGAWSIPPTAHGWLLCGSPTRLSTMFILSVGKILFELTRISNNVKVWYFDFWGEVGKFRPSQFVPHEWVGSPNFESHLGILLRDGCACGARVKFGIRNVRRVNLTDI